MTPGQVRAALHRKIHRLVPLRWSTLLMVVAFLGLGALYLDVRTAPPAKVYVATTPVTTAESSTTRVPATTTTESATTSAQPTTSTTGGTSSTSRSATSTTSGASSTTANPGPGAGGSTSSSTTSSPQP